MSDVNETVNLWYGHLSMLLVAGDRLDTVTYLQEKEQLVGNALRERNGMRFPKDCVRQ